LVNGLKDCIWRINVYISNTLIKMDYIRYNTSCKAVANKRKVVRVFSFLLFSLILAYIIVFLRLNIGIGSSAFAGIANALNAL